MHSLQVLFSWDNKKKIIILRFGRKELEYYKQEERNCPDFAKKKKKKKKKKNKKLWS